MNYSEQAELKKRLIEKDSEEVISWRSTDDSNQFKNLRLIGGVDISFDKQNPDRACAILCVLSFPDLKVNYFCIYKPMYLLEFHCINCFVMLTGNR